MSSTQNVGNNVGAVNDFQPFMDAPNLAGAHGKRNVAVSKRTGSITSKTKISSRSFSSKATLRSQRKVDTRTPSQLKTIVNLSESQQVFHSLIRRGTISTEAKAVYSAALVILDEVAKCKDFSATNIQKAIKIGLNHVGNTTGFKGTVGFFKEDEDGGVYEKGMQKKSKHGTPGLKGLINNKGEPIPIQKGQNQGIKLCDQLKLEKKTSQPENKNLPNPQNPTNIEIDLENPTINDNIISYGFKNEKDETVKDLTISCPKGFKIENYSGQIKREIVQFNGNVTIHRLEPGTVLVRVFGEGQSILSSCWCNAADSTSTVKEAKDLYNTLAVRPDWNGDGNLGIWVIPEGVDIYVAEGKIASQVGPYSEFEMQSTTEVIDGVKQSEKCQKDFFYIFEGGGTQLNILTSNSGLFADVANQSIFEQTMFVFRDDEMIDPYKLTNLNVKE